MVIMSEKINEFEAPAGFIAVSKNEASTPNICNSCDARVLCRENKDDWCLINRCMPFEIISFKDGKIYKRNDGQSVLFKFINQYGIPFGGSY
jgi:hypothetical protein